MITVIEIGMRSCFLLLFLFLGAFAKAADSTNEDVTIRVGDIDRTAIVHLPQLPDDGSTPKLPVVLNLHALGMNSEMLQEVCQLDDLADKENFIAVYPNGHSVAGIFPKANKVPLFSRKSLMSRILRKETKFLSNMRSWNGGGCCPQACNNAIDEIGFFRKLVEYIQTDMAEEHGFAVDAERIYVMGVSNGGFMTYRVACEMSDIVAAVSPIAGVLSHTEKQVEVFDGDPFKCPSENQRPIPVLHMHCKGDPIVPPDGLNSWVFIGQGDKRLPTVNSSLAEFREINGVTDSDGVVVYDDSDSRWFPNPLRLFRPPSTKCISYGDDTDFPVEYCEINKSGPLAHCYPGEGPIGKFCGNRIGNEYIWKFFKKYTLSKGEKNDSSEDTVLSSQRDNEL